MHRIHIFLNHNASQSASHDWERVIRTKLYRSELTFQPPGTTADFHLAVKAAIATKVDVLIAVGGDGTMSHLIQELAGHDSAFLILPAGTANDLARVLGVYASSMQRAVDVVRQDRWKRMDLIQINDRFMATNGGIGLVSDVAQQINRLREIVPGFRLLMRVMKQEVYGILLGGSILASGVKPRHLYVESDMFTGEITTPLFLVNNQPAIGGSFTVAPHTRHDDGAFNVTFFTPGSTRQFLYSAYRVRRRFGPENDPQVQSFETSAIKIKALDGKPLDFVGDGELLASDLELSISIRPKYLKVFSQAKPALMRTVRSQRVRGGAA